LAGLPWTYRQNVYQHIVIPSQARSVLSDAAAVRSKSLRAAHSVLVVDDVCASDEFLVPTSGGFEGMALTTNGQYLLPLLERLLQGSENRETRDWSVGMQESRIVGSIEHSPLPYSTVVCVRRRIDECRMGQTHFV
jgi:hypothetical protein